MLEQLIWSGPNIGTHFINIITKMIIWHPFFIALEYNFDVAELDDMLRVFLSLYENN